MESHETRAVLEISVPAQGTAGAAQDFVLGRSPIAGVVSDVVMIPEAALTANGTNYRTFRVLNKGQSGSGSTVVASFATDTPTTDDLVAFDERSIPLSGTASNLNVAVGDVLVLDETVAGSGIAHSGYKAVVEIRRS